MLFLPSIELQYSVGQENMFAVSQIQLEVFVANYFEQKDLFFLPNQYHAWTLLISSFRNLKVSLTWIIGHNPKCHSYNSVRRYVVIDDCSHRPALCIFTLSVSFVCDD